MKKTLVMLPGLDGTEIFMQPFAGALPSDVQPLLVSYPAAGANRYADLFPLVREAVEGLTEFHVLGWSFSGPLALMLAAAEPRRVRSVTLSATFVRPPRPDLAALHAELVEPSLWLWREARQPKAQNWRRFSPRALARRLRAVMTVDAREALRSCRQPTLYLAASRDALVPRRCLDEILRVRPTVRVATIEGEHFAMYSNPHAAARAVAAFIAEAA
jgi:pimeloyl-ACP methyl ester carboxylesterase